MEAVYGSQILRLFCWAWVLSHIAVAETLPNAPDVPFVDLVNQAKAAERSHAYELAEQLFRRALAQLHDGPQVTAVTLWNELGYTHQQQARLEDAINDYHKALEINLALENPDEVERATSIGNLGSVAMRQGSFADAENRFREALTGLDRNGLTNTRVGATVLSNLGFVLRKQLQFDAARDVYRKAEDAVIRTLGKNSAQYARLLVGIAQVSYATGNYSDAIEKDRCALQLENTVDGIDARDKATVANDLGLALSAAGQQVEAESLFTSAVELYKSTHLLQDRALVETLNNLVLALIRSGNLELAEQSEQEAQDLCMKWADPDDATLANLHNTLGVIAMNRQDRHKARAELTEALNTWEKIKGANTPEYSAALTNLATLDDKSGDHKRAEELYRNALAIDEVRLGLKHPRVADDVANVAAELFHRKQADEALRLYTQAKSIQEASFGPKSIQVASLWHSIGIVQHASKHLNESSEAYAHAVAAFKASASPDSKEFYSCLREYATLLRILQKFDEAEETDLLATRIQVADAIHAQGNGGSDRKTTLGFR